MSQNSEASISSEQSSVSSSPAVEPASQQNQEVSNRETEPRPGPSEVGKNTRDSSCNSVV